MSEATCTRRIPPLEDYLPDLIHPLSSSQSRRILQPVSPSRFRRRVYVLSLPDPPTQHPCTRYLACSDLGLRLRPAGRDLSRPSPWRDPLHGGDRCQPPDPHSRDAHVLTLHASSSAAILASGLPPPVHFADPKRSPLGACQRSPRLSSRHDRRQDAWVSATIPVGLAHGGRGTEDGGVPGL